MPKFIGNNSEDLVRAAERRARGPIGTVQAIAKSNAQPPPGCHRVKYNTAVVQLSRGASVAYSLDTTDKGGRRSLAKRWNRWFVCDRSTLGGLKRKRRKARR